MLGRPLSVYLCRLAGSLGSFQEGTCERRALNRGESIWIWSSERPAGRAGEDQPTRRLHPISLWCWPYCALVVAVVAVAVALGASAHARRRRRLRGGGTTPVPLQLAAILPLFAPSMRQPPLCAGSLSLSLSRCALYPLLSRRPGAPSKRAQLNLNLGRVHVVRFARNCKRTAEAATAALSKRAQHANSRVAHSS